MQVLLCDDKVTCNHKKLKLIHVNSALLILPSILGFHCNSRKINDFHFLCCQNISLTATIINSAPFPHPLHSSHIIWQYQRHQKDTIVVLSGPPQETVRSSSFKRQPSPQMGNQITHTADMCMHICWRNAHLRLAGYPPIQCWPLNCVCNNSPPQPHTHTNTHTHKTPGVSYHRVRLSVKWANSIYMSWTLAVWHTQTHR